MTTRNPSSARCGLVPRLASVVVVALVSAACRPPMPPVPAPRGPTGEEMEQPRPPSETDEQTAEALQAEAQAAEKAGDVSQANAKRDQLVDIYAGTAAGARELQAQAEAAAQAGDIKGAVALYEKLLFYRPSFPEADAVRETYALLLVKLERFSDAANMLSALYESAGNDAARERLGMALAHALARNGEARQAVSVYVKVHALEGASTTTRERAAQQARQIALGDLDFKEAEQLWSDVESRRDWTFLQPALAYKLAKIYYHVRDFERSEQMLRLVSSRFAESPYGGPARDFLARLLNRFKVDPHRIGVVLPLSGRVKAYGLRALEAIKLALGPDTPYELVVKDSQGEAPLAAKAVEQLVLDDHVVAIIGPLFSGEALAASLKAEELSVPIVALSYRDGLPELGSWVFRAALTIKAQAKALAEVAFEQLGMSRFALLYPRNRYGIDFMNAFWDEVDQRKGEIRGVESYEHDQTTFQEPVRKLVGRYYSFARGDYREALNDIRARHLPSHRERHAVEELNKTLKPVVDFDAIVIPDSGRNIGLIAPALAFEDIVMTHDPRLLERIKKAMGRDDIRPISLLGASTWNSSQTVESCERYCEDSVFVDAYYPDSPNPKVRDFVAAFRDSTGAEPRLEDAQAYDAAGLVRSALTTARPATREALRDALLGLRGYDGVTGRITFDANGEVQKKLLVLTIKDGLIREWVRAPEEPQG